ncbi:MAG: hypothetical protein Q8J74_10635, partial [Candidatus Didemnitutus sp.]|nr:hypothetical protein [Candidatus Didemnitutus sp.]
MKFPLLFTRHSRRSIVIEINQYQILVAGLNRPDAESVLLDSYAEFAADDDAGLRAWLRDHADHQNAWVPAICGLFTHDALLQRNSISSRRLAEPGYLSEFTAEQFKIANTDQWKLHALTPLEGKPVPSEGGQRPVLMCGLRHETVHQLQQRLLDHRLLPYQLEFSPLPLFGAIYDQQARAGDTRAIVVLDIGQDQTVAYILGKEGVHTPAVVPHGFSSIVAAARKELRLGEAEEVADRLHNPDEEILHRATKLVRPLGRDLKPLIDSYEMTTGQPVGEIYCAHLPPSLTWIAQPLAQVIGGNAYQIDSEAWMENVNVRVAPNLEPFGPHWISVLSLLAHLPAALPKTTPRADNPYKAAWRVDFRLSAQLPSNDLVRRRFLKNVVAVTFATVALIFTLWQGYSVHFSRSETAYWHQRIAENAVPFAQHEKDSRKFSQLAARVDQAWTLLHSPHFVTETLME